MRACQHYVEAEKVLAAIAATSSPASVEDQEVLLSIGQLHATLALAGATALQSYARVGDSDDELLAWELAAGGES